MNTLNTNDSISATAHSGEKLWSESSTSQLTPVAGAESFPRDLKAPESASKNVTFNRISNTGDRDFANTMSSTSE